MGTDIRYVRDPDFVWLSYIELALQMIRRHHGRRSTAFEAALSIARLRAQARGAHDPVNAIDSALLAQVAQIIRYFPIAVHRTAFQPRLFDVSKQAPVFRCPLTFGLGAPSIKTTRMHRHHLAKPSDRMLIASIANEGVPYPDILAKYAAAFFKISRSSVTRFSSAFRRFISAC